MSNDLLSLAPDALSTVIGGSAKTSQAELKLAMTQIKDSLSSFKKQVTSSSSSDAMPMIMMMMAMKNR